VASISITSGAQASIPWSGTRSTARHATARTLARAAWIARDAAAASWASRSTVRDTVGGGRALARLGRSARRRRRPVGGRGLRVETLNLLHDEMPLAQHGQRSGDLDQQ
jgi:hypothetical protein